MRKSTLSFFAALAAMHLSYGQVTLSVTAPPPQQASSLIAPSGDPNQATVRGCFLIQNYELASLATGSVISSVELSLLFGTATIPVTGSFTLYLENTIDNNYVKPYTFSGATAGMTNVYSGNLTVPVSNNATTIPIPINPGFNYTGNGLYVAYDWSSAGPFDPNPAAININGDFLGTPFPNAIAVGAAPAPDAMNSTGYRPTFVFVAANTATNNIAMVNVGNYGQIPATVNNGLQTLTADIQNRSTIPQTNIVVSMSVTGANPIAVNTQTIPSLAAGAVATVTFAPFNSPATGANNIFVYLPNPDQNPNDDELFVGEDATCNRVALCRNAPAMAYNSVGLGFSAGNSGIYAFKYAPTASASLTSIEMAVPGLNQNIGAKPYGVLLNSAGAVIATSNTLTLAAADFSTYVSFNFSSPQALTANSTYYFGVAVPQGGTNPVGASQQITSPSPGFYRSSLTGGVFTPVNSLMPGIRAIIHSSVTAISATTTKSVICKGEQAQLNVSGSLSYTWSANANSATTSSVLVSPTVTTTYTVQGTHAASGCLSNMSMVTQSVSLCTGLLASGTLGSEIRLSPNPAIGGKSTISGLDGVNTIEVFNIAGQLILTQQSLQENADIDLSGEANGTYLIKITDANAVSKTVKIVNQH